MCLKNAPVGTTWGGGGWMSYAELAATLYKIHYNIE